VSGGERYIEGVGYLRRKFGYLGLGYFGRKVGLGLAVFLTTVKALFTFDLLVKAVIKAVLYV